MPSKAPTVCAPPKPPIPGKTRTHRPANRPKSVHRPHNFQNTLHIQKCSTWNIPAKSAPSSSANLSVMRSSLLAVPALLFAVSATAQAPKPVAARLAAQNALFEETWQTQLKLSPTLATAVGDYRYNDQLGDYSLAATAHRHELDIAEPRPHQGHRRHRLSRAGPHLARPLPAPALSSASRTTT